MRNWFKQRPPVAPPKPEPPREDTEAAQREALIARLFCENSELRAMVVQLDAAVTDLSIQLWGKRAYDRAVDQARRNGNN